MLKKNISGRNLDNSIDAVLKNTITSDDILGKDVIDTEGVFIGIAEKVLIDPKGLDFVGIEVDKGFLKKGLSIGKSYIERIMASAVFLNIRVVYEIKGMKVFDKIGGLVGTVRDVELIGEKNSLKQIIVRQGMIKKDIEIPAEFIQTIGENVILNVLKQELTL